MNDKFRDHTATAFGICTSLVTAYAVIDFDTFDPHKPSNIMKLIILGLPAIGGYMSKIKNPDQGGQG